MTVTFTNLDTNSSTTDTTGAFSTAAVSPTAGQPVLLAVLTSVASGATPTAVIDGCSLTWTLVNNTVVGARTLWLFLGIGASPTSGTVNINGDGGTSVTSAFWSLVQCAGVDTATNNGVKQSHQGKPATNTSLSASFAGTVASTNGTFAAVAVAAADSTLTQGSGWTAVAPAMTETAPTSAFIAEYASTGQQTISATWTTSAANFNVAVEMTAANLNPTLSGSVGLHDAVTLARGVVASASSASTGFGTEPFGTGPFGSGSGGSQVTITDSVSTSVTNVVAAAPADSERLTDSVSTSLSHNTSVTSAGSLGLTDHVTSVLNTQNPHLPGVSSISQAVGSAALANQGVVNDAVLTSVGVNGATLGALLNGATIATT